MNALLNYAEAAELVGVPETTVRQWRSRHHLDPVGTHHGLLLFRKEDVLRANREAMECPGGRKRKGAGS
jgi:predicted site-specific integrase-resolvase